MRRSTLPLTFSRLSRRLLGAALSLVLLAGAGEQAQLAWAQPTSFEGAALVPVLGQGDIVKARSQALSEALSRALEQAVAEVLPEARSRVYLVSGRARDYVTTYRVLQEGEVAGQFQIRIAAELDLPRLQRDLGGAAPGSLASTANPTTIYVCTTQALPAAQVALEALRAGLKESLPSVELAAAAQCKQSPDFAALPGALGLLILTPSSTPAESLRGPQPPQYGAQGRAHLQLVRPGRELVPATGDAVGFGPEASAAESEAQRQATLAGLRLLLASMGPLVRSGAGVVVRVENLGSFRAYQQILRVLTALPGVSRVEPRRFYLPGRAVSGEEAQVQLLLQTSATVDSLAATLGRTPLSGLQLQVMPLGEGELRVLCAPEGALPNPAQPADSSETSDADKQVSVP